MPSGRILPAVPERRYRRGFTLVEMLVAFTIAGILVALIYNIFISGGRQMTFGMWRSGSNIQLRNGLRRIREDIAKASYKSIIQDLSVTVEREESYGWWLRWREGELTLPAAGATPLLRWYICKSGRGATPPTVIEAELVADGRDLKYSKIPHATNTGPLEEGDTFASRAIIKDVEKVKIHADPALSDEELTVEIKVRTCHPTHPNVSLEQTVSVKVPVRIKPL